MKDLWKKQVPVLLFFITTMLPLVLWNGLQGVDNLYMYAHGEDMLANGFVRTTDIFSMHEGFAFLYQKWAACLLTYGIVRFFGWQGLTVATYCLIFLLLSCLYFFGKKYNPSYGMINSIAVMTCAYLMEANGTLRFRPHVMAGVVFIYLFLFIEKYARGEVRADLFFYLRFMAASVVLMWFHSTMWILYLVVFLPYVMDFAWYGKRFPRLFAAAPYGKGPLWAAMALMFAVGACNPNGLRQYGYMLACLKATGEKYAHVDELQSIPFPAYLVVFVTGCLLLAWMGHLTWVKRVQIHMPCLYLVCGSLLLPLVSWRLVFYSALFFAVACILQTGQAGGQEPVTDPRAIPAVFGILCMVILMAGGLSRLSVASSTKEALACGTKIQDINDAVDLVAGMDGSATVFTTTAHAGSYSIYRKLRPYMDCRAEVYDDAINKTSDILSQIHGLSSGTYKGMPLADGGLEQLQQDYRPDYYVLTRYSDADRNMKDALEKTDAVCLYDSHDVWVYRY